MYGKHFTSMYSGSMVGSGACVFAVWGFVISHAIDSRVELNPKLLSAIIGEPEETIRLAIAKLMEPDDESRSKVNDGRRLIREGQFQYFVPTWENYRKIRQEEERREYNREMQRKHRASKNVNDNKHCQDSSAMSAHTEAEAYSEEELRGRPSTVACSEPGKPASKPNDDSPIVMEFDTVKGRDGKTKWNLRQSNVDALAASFPGVDVLAECRKAHGWLYSNPPKRKTGAGMKRFLFGWMERAQNRGGSSIYEPGGNGKKPSTNSSAPPPLLKPLVYGPM